MKKLVLVVFALVLALTIVGCGKKEVEYKLGMGVEVSLESSKTGQAQVDATVATVVTDKDGKIVLCRIDVAQNKAKIADGKATVPAEYKTKKELQGDYGMASAKIDNDGNGVTKEWFEQAEAFETYVVGKTGAEVKALELKEANGHQISTDKALLDAGCSIDITGFIAAVVKACDDAQGMSFTAVEGSFTLGVAATSFNDGSTEPVEAAEGAEAKDGVVKMYTDFAATVVAEGKILAALNDAIQPQISYNAAGEITNKKYSDTKRCLKDGYGMAPAKIDNDGNGVTKEWFEQSEAFSKFVVGKTAAEVSGLETQEKGGHQIATDQALLDAGCSIQITAIKAVVAKAVNNAK